MNFLREVLVWHSTKNFTFVENNVMKTFLSYFLLLAIVISSQNVLSQEGSILEKVANAHGLENWKNVKEIQFTFNVDRGGELFSRNWVWNTKQGKVTMRSEKDTVSYSRKSVDDTLKETDANFINDKFWLLAPFQLVWDGDNIEHEHTGDSQAPISKKPMQKLTIVYGNEGGYTPGDAYDFYFGDDHIIQEWVFRKANQPEPSMITTFEDYEEVNGLKIAKMHKMGEGNFKLFFTNLSVETN